MSLKQVLKNAVRNIIQEKYESYEKAFEVLNIKRRGKLIGTFGRKCLQPDETEELFPINEIKHNMKTRNQEVVYANTEMLKNSTVPYIQRVFNQNEHFQNA